MTRRPVTFNTGKPDTDSGLGGKTTGLHRRHPGKIGGEIEEYVQGTPEHRLMDRIE